MNGLRTVGLVKRYGALAALRGIDLEVPAGAIYGLVGPNGSGKTTALEIMAGLRRASAGRIELGVAQDAVAYCPDAVEFEPWLTAVEVLDVAVGLLGRRRSRAALDDMLRRVGLSSAANRRVGGFSHGMRSRLGLAAGLIGEPRVLIADEPAAALDPAGRREVLEIIAALAGSVTVIISSHDLADVERICDRIGVLADGSLVYQGSVAQLLDRAAPTLRVVVRPPADQLIIALAAAPWVRSVEEGEPGDLKIDATDRDSAERQLPGILADCGVRLIEVSPAGVRLQEIFFELTATGPSRDQTERER